LYQSQLVFAFSLTENLKKNSGLRAHKSETVLRKGHQPEDPLSFPHPGDTTTRKAHDPTVISRSCRGCPTGQPFLSQI